MLTGGKLQKTDKQQHKTNHFDRMSVLNERCGRHKARGVY
jgi:hypothetical protein